MSPYKIKFSTLTHRNVNVHKYKCKLNSKSSFLFLKVKNQMKQQTNIVRYITFIQQRISNLYHLRLYRIPGCVAAQ